MESEFFYIMIYEIFACRLLCLLDVKLIHYTLIIKHFKYIFFYCRKTIFDYTKKNIHIQKVYYYTDFK